MKNGKIIALTGGIGSGKSSVGKYLGEKGYTVLDADGISRGLSERKDFLSEIARLFGENFVQGGKLDRRALAEYCFSDKERTEKLNALFHGEVYKEIFALAEESFSRGEKLCFAEIPLLFETGKQKEFDEVWIVSAPENVRIERVRKRSGLSEAEIRLRIAAQYDYERAEGRILRNAGTEDELKAEVDELLKETENDLRKNLRA